MRLSFQFVQILKCLSQLNPKSLDGLLNEAKNSFSDEIHQVQIIVTKKEECFDRARAFILSLNEHRDYFYLDQIPKSINKKNNQRFFSQI